MPPLFVAIGILCVGRFAAAQALHGTTDGSMTGGAIVDLATETAGNSDLTVSVVGASAEFARSAAFYDTSGPDRLGEPNRRRRGAWPSWIGAEFSADGSRRRLDLDATVLSTPRAKLALTGVLFDSRHPSDRSALGIGLPLGWEVQAVRGFQLELNALGDRLRFQTGASWSRLTTNQADHQPAPQRGGDLRHELNFDLVRGGSVAVSAYGTYRNIGSGYRPPETGADEEEDEASPGRAWEFGLRFADDRMEVLLSHTMVDHRDAEAPEGGYAGERIDHASLSLMLEPFYETFGHRWPLLPRMMTVSWSRTGVESDHASDGHADPSRTLGLELAWWWHGAETTFGLSRSYTGGRLAGPDGAGSDDLSIELSHTITRGDWELLLSYSAARSNYVEWGSHWTTTNHTAGATLSIGPENLPDLSVSLDVYKDRSKSKDIWATARSRSASLDTSLDFSKFVWPSARGEGPRLKILYRSEMGESRDSVSGAMAEAEHAVMFSTEFRF